VVYVLQAGEFKGIRETGFFHLPELPDLKLFGMDKALWTTRHSNQIVSGTAEAAFDTHDADGNGRLNRREYDTAIMSLRAEV
jgi:hypothetical protein